MKILIVLIFSVLFCVFISRSNSNDEKFTITNKAIVEYSAPFSSTKFVHLDHDYIIFHFSAYGTFNDPVVHDPDCKCKGIK